MSDPSPSRPADTPTPDRVLRKGNLEGKVIPRPSPNPPRVPDKPKPPR